MRMSRTRSEKQGRRRDDRGEERRRKRRPCWVTAPCLTGDVDPVPPTVPHDDDSHRTAHDADQSSFGQSNPSR
jgi:hypothetical protein